MAVMNVNPTRMELTRLKKRLVTAVRGHKLLKDKRDELMRRFLDLIRENKALREQVEAGIREANRHFVLASAVMQKEALDAALLTPKQEVGLEVSSRNVMSVDIPVFHTAPRTEEKGDSYPSTASPLLPSSWTARWRSWRGCCLLCCGWRNVRRPPSCLRRRSKRPAGGSTPWST